MIETVPFERRRRDAAAALFRAEWEREAQITPYPPWRDPAVDCETLNPTALRFRGKYFVPFTYSFCRRIDERC